MFKKRNSIRGSKDFLAATTSSSPEPAMAALAVASPNPPPEAAKPKPKPKPTGPPSIIPPGTKRVLVVGKGVVMTADVDNCDAVIVQGNLDGNVKSKYVVIMKGGCMRGKVECEEADVAGSFEGVEMIVHHRLALADTARVGGNTTYHRLAVHEGAILTGELVYKPSKRDSPKPSKRDVPKPSAKAGEVPTPEVAAGAVPVEETTSGTPAVGSEPPPEKTTAAKNGLSKE